MNLINESVIIKTAKLFYLMKLLESTNHFCNFCSLESWWKKGNESGWFLWIFMNLRLSWTHFLIPWYHSKYFTAYSSWKYLHTILYILIYLAVNDTYTVMSCRSFTMICVCQDNILHNHFMLSHCKITKMNRI